MHELLLEKVDVIGNREILSDFLNIDRILRYMTKDKISVSGFFLKKGKIYNPLVVRLYFSDVKDDNKLIDRFVDMSKEYVKLLSVFLVVSKNNYNIKNIDKDVYIDFTYSYSASDKMLAITVEAWNVKKYNTRQKILEEIDYRYLMDYLGEILVFRYSLIYKNEYIIHSSHKDHISHKKYKIVKERDVSDNGFDFHSYQVLCRDWKNFHKSFIEYINSSPILSKLKSYLIKKGLINDNFTLKDGIYFYQVKNAINAFFKKEASNFQVCPICGELYAVTRKNKFVCSKKCKVLKSQTLKPEIEMIYYDVMQDTSIKEDKYLVYMKRVREWNKKRLSANKRGNKPKKIFDIDRISDQIYDELEKKT